MSDGAGDQAPIPPEALVRVQPISDPKAFKRHLLRMFDQGQPRYADLYDADAEPWNLWPEMVTDFAEEWELLATGGRRSVLALALTFSMPSGTDMTINEAAVLAMARRAFAGHDRVWVAGEHEGPFVKMLVAHYDEDDRPLSSGLADLRKLSRRLCPRAKRPRRRGPGDHPRQPGGLGSTKPGTPIRRASDQATADRSCPQAIRPTQ